MSYKIFGIIAICAAILVPLICDFGTCDAVMFAVTFIMAGLGFLIIGTSFPKKKKRI